MVTVIVFGPTGKVASIAARTAAEKGAKVFLAMRDPQKAVPGLDSEQERNGSFVRVQADLTKPDSVAAAVKQSGATRAFIYIAFGTQDHMKATLEALKSAGIQVVIFLSSYTITGEPSEVEQSDMIPWVHAQVEINLDAVFGRQRYVAIRPGGFATNMLQVKDQIASGNVELYGPHYKFDCVTPLSMGRACGTILVEGTKDGRHIVYLYGPEELTYQRCVEQIAQVLGRKVSISHIDREEGRKQFLDRGYPKPMVDYMVKKIEETADSGVQSRPQFEAGVQNVMTYTGSPSQSLKEWVEENKKLFA